MIRFAVSVSAVLVFAAILSAPAAAQETFHTCVGFIDEVPATITTQGVWCLRRDLGTNITSGVAIAIAAPNVTIACNQFKLGGLAAGPNTEARGIESRAPNTTIRGCNVRGFWYGIGIFSAGAVVEDNRLDGNLNLPIVVDGDRFTVRRNLVLASGRRNPGDWAAAIYVSGSTGDILDNVVTDVLSESVKGIVAFHVREIVIAGNRVKGLAGGPGGAVAIEVVGGGWATGNYAILRGNDVIGEGVHGVGLQCRFGAVGMARDNTIGGFSAAFDGCTNAIGNVIW